MNQNRSITRRGGALAGGSVALLAGGVLSGDGIFILLGLCGILLLGLAWIMAKTNLRRLTPRIHLPSQVAASVPFNLELTLHNRRQLLDAFNIEILLQLPGKITCLTIAPWTPAGSASRIHQQIVIPSRGYQDSHPCTMSTTFPLGLFCLKRDLEIRQTITATPQPIIPVELSNHGALLDTMPRSGLTTGQTFGEPRGIRPWQAGDSARRIHWPASARSLARGHGLRVREYDPPGFQPDHCHLVFHSFATGGEMLREDRFERSLSLLTGTLIELQQRSIPCTVTSDFLDWQNIPCSNKNQLVEFLMTLAKINRSQGTEAHDLENIFHAVAPEHTLMIISDMIPDSWQHLLSKHPKTLIVDIRQIRYRHRPLHSGKLSAN